MTTYCLHCAHVHQDSKKSSPRYWLCTKHPQAEGFGFVTPDTWDKAEPYLRCSQVNGGFCPLYEKDPGTQTKLGV